jgi:hypothetical protein
MKRNTAVFLQAMLLLTGAGALALLLWEPHLEGRNAHATLFQVYFNDPFLAYAYVGSIPFFAGLYQVFKLLGHAAENAASSHAARMALRSLKYCALSLVVLIAAPVAYLLVARPGDDIAGGVAVGLFLILASATVAVIAAVCERTLAHQGRSNP